MGRLSGQPGGLITRSGPALRAARLGEAASRRLAAASRASGAFCPRGREAGDRRGRVDGGGGGGGRWGMIARLQRGRAAQSWV